MRALIHGQGLLKAFKLYMATRKSLLFLIILALLFAVFSAAWIARAQIAEYIAVASMEQAGLTEITAKIHSVELNQSQITSLDLTILTETGELKLEAQDITIDYQTASVMEGKLEKITINNLIVTYKALHPKADQNQLATANNSLEPIRAIAIFRQALRDYLLIEALSIEKLSFNGTDFSVLQNKQFQLESRIEEKTLSSELSLIVDSTPQQSFYLSLNSDFMLIELRMMKQKTTLPVVLEINIDESEISGVYTVEPELLKTWLQPFATIKDIGFIKAVNGSVSIYFEQSGQVKSTLIVNSDEFSYDAYHIDNFGLKLKLVIEDKLPLRNVHLANGSSLSTDAITYQQSLLTNNVIYMKGDLQQLQDDWGFSGGLRFNRFRVTHDSKNIWIKEIAARVTVSKDLLKINGDISPDTIPAKFDFSVRHNLIKASGELTIRQHNPIDFTSDTAKLSQILTPWPYPFDILTGLIYLESDGKWSQDTPFSLTSNIKLEEIGGNINELLFSGLSFHHELEVLPDLHSIHTSTINLAHIDGGVSIDDIKTDFTIKSSRESQPKFVLNNLYGKIFNGTFTSDEIIYDLNHSKHLFKINANGIDLAEIVKTQQLNDIEVTGKISGQIPVELNDDGLSIKDGAFINDVSNGTIRYNPEAGTEQLKQNPLTGIALNALKDFRYNHLSADVNFTPEGILGINLQLKGSSPELDKNRPVHLNVNTEQNLLSLLKSLRYAQGVSDKIDSRVQRQYEQAP